MPQHNAPSRHREIADVRLPVTSGWTHLDLGDDRVRGAVDDVVLVPNAAIEAHGVDAEVLRQTPHADGVNAVSIGECHGGLEDAFLPPRWIIRILWRLHRAIYALSGGRLVLRPPADRQWGMLRLTTLGRRTARKRRVILGYIEDGANLITPAMNGWAEPEPGWWLNLQADPHAVVELPNGTTRAVTARAAEPDERRQLWRRLVDLGTSAYTDAYAGMRSRETAIVILQPAVD